MSNSGVTTSNRANQISDLIYKKEYEQAARALAELKKEYALLETNSYFKQMLLLLEGTVNWENPVNGEGLTELIAALKITRADLIRKENKRKNEQEEKKEEKKMVCLDTAAIAQGHFSSVEYDILKEIAVVLSMSGCHQHSLAIYQALLTSLDHDLVSFEIKTGLFSVLCYYISYELSRTKDHEQAIWYATRGVDFCKQTGQVKSLHYLFDLLGNIYHELGDAEKASAYLDSTHKLMFLLAHSC